jgi:hypothetical protein
MACRRTAGHKTSTGIGQYLLLWRLIEHTTLATTADRLVRRWNTSGTYTAQSAYLATFQGSMRCRVWKLIWKSWDTTEIQVFPLDLQFGSLWEGGEAGEASPTAPPKMPPLRPANGDAEECPFSSQVWHDISPGCA